MLFVSKKEPLTTETLPDTSLHNVREQAESQNSLLSSSSESSSAFFQLPQACFSKLTKEQFNLHREFLRLGSLLMTENVDLFHNALTMLSAKHEIKMSTPKTCVSGIIPPSRIPRRYNKTQNTAHLRPSNRKYILPKEIEEKEFYQCTICKERRATNSFGSEHSHKESVKPTIRWYCPLCDSFFAVTHRGYHVKNRHSDISSIAHQDCPTEKSENKSVSPAVDPSSLKRTSDVCSVEDESDYMSLSPPGKVSHLLDSSSPCSTVSTDSVESYNSKGDALEDETNSSMSSLFIDHCQMLNQGAELFNGDDVFSVFPSQQEKDGECLFDDQASADPSSFSF